MEIIDIKVWYNMKVEAWQDRNKSKMDKGEGGERERQHKQRDRREEKKEHRDKKGGMEGKMSTRERQREKGGGELRKRECLEELRAGP